MGDMMTTRGFAILSLCLAACHHAPPAEPPVPAPRPEPIVRKRVVASFLARGADVSEFVPLVPAVDTGGQCGVIPSGMFKAGESALWYTFGPPGQMTRTIVVQFDSTGRPTRYSDARGDLRSPPESDTPLPCAGPRTTISLNLLEHTGALQNERANPPEVALRVMGSDLVDAANLGTPSAMIERITRECGAR